MKIVDCFPYFNEKELLEFRIKLLYDKVDKFIICDADRTHSGKPKPFTCIDTLKELGLWTEKITVINVSLPSNSEEPDAWVRERAQRDAASQFIDDDEVCIVSDCDEIINPDLIDYYVSVAQQHPQFILRIPLVYLNGRGDLRVYDENDNPVYWNEAYICLKSHREKYTLSQIRESNSRGLHNIDYPDNFITEEEKMIDSGWHFSWMGDLNRMKIKADSFLHHDEVSLVENYSPEVNNTDPLGRNDHILKEYDINLLPSKLFELDRVRNFIFPSRTWKDIQGFFEYPSFYDMCMKEIPNDSVMVEVGSWVGRSSTYVASLIKESGKNIKFYCIDTWEGSEEHQDIIKSLKEQGKTLFDEFQTNILSCGVKDYIIPIKLESIEAAKQFEDESIDFIHIDAAHDYENVLADIRAWYPKIKPGGLITGDDYGWEGVYKAVNEFFGIDNITYYEHDNKGGCLWTCKKPDQAEKKYSYLFKQ